jgi:hypothetical protein
MLCFYESCSLETLRNALTVLHEWKVITVTKVNQKTSSIINVSLLHPYQVIIDISSSSSRLVHGVDMKCQCVLCL